MDPHPRALSTTTTRDQDMNDQIAYRIRPNYCPCPHNPPNFLLYFTYYCPLADLFPDFLLYIHLLSPT